MYLLKERDLTGVDPAEIQARLAIVQYLRDWAVEVFAEARTKQTMSLAGRYIRSQVLEKEGTLIKLLDEVVLIDLTDFWKAVDGYQGKRDDVILYGIFCMLFSEVDEAIYKESIKLEGNIGFIPRLRFDISERRGSEVEQTSNKKGIFRRKKKQTNEVDKSEGVNEPSEPIEEEENKEHQLEEEQQSEEEQRVEIKDKFVRPDNVNKLTIIVASIISLSVIVLAWMLLI